MGVDWSAGSREMVWGVEGKRVWADRLEHTLVPKEVRV